MPEQYVGTKFRTVFARREAPRDIRLPELVTQCRRWAELGLGGDTVGNLSCRTADGFLINRTAGDLGTITSEEFVEVLEANIAGRAVTVAGLFEPSSESLMHAGIFAARPEVNAIFHGHSARLLAAAERLGLPITAREQPYGTPDLVAEILAVLGDHKLVIMRGHGFVSLGATMDEAVRNAEEVLQKISPEIPGSK
jgi:ribulose-5-phosphate 4-epimerase/fuculose-1-phosphate aldolase